MPAPATGLGGIFGGLGNFLSGTGGDILGAGLGIDAFNDLKDRGKQAETAAGKLGKQAQKDSQFKPFTVSTGFGSISTDPLGTGGYTTTLSPAQQQQQQALQGITGGLISGMGGMGGLPFMGDMGNGPAGGYASNRPPTESQPMFSSADIGLNGKPSVDNSGKYINSLTGEIVEGGPANGGSFFNAGGQNPAQLVVGGGSGGQNPAPSMPMSDQAGIESQAFGGVRGLLAQAQNGIAGREQSIYDRIRATQLPEEQRQQLGLDQKLASQGRTGLRTAMFGGSPEQFAMEQARAEAMNNASLASIGQAGTQRTQDLEAASSMFGLGSKAQQNPYAIEGLQQGLTGGNLGNIASSMGLQYMPEQQLLATLNPGINLSDIQNTGARFGANLYGEATAAGIEARLAADAKRAEGLAGMYNALLNSEPNAGASENSEGGFFNWLNNNLFG